MGNKPPGRGAGDSPASGGLLSPINRNRTGSINKSANKKEKGVSYRVVKATCPGTGETTVTLVAPRSTILSLHTPVQDVECKPVDLDATVLIPGAPPPLRPGAFQPTLQHCPPFTALSHRSNIVRG